MRRYLGSSDHSAVFLTEARHATSADLAIKIVPAIPEYADVQLSRWLTAGEMDHPHLVGIFEAGRCQVDGQPYLYAVMEYADQDLGQLLQRRSLTEDEARQMLMPMLSALGFLHAKKFVQGRVKPSNVLVVGDQLKLSSDTICRVGEAVESGASISAYESPEARESGRSTAGDIWALGVTICEALTRRQPLALHAGGNPVFPVDLPPAFRELAAWCLSRRAADRPEVSELEASLRGERTVPIPIPAVEPGAIGHEPAAGTSAAGEMSDAAGAPTAAASAPSGAATAAAYVASGSATSAAAVRPAAAGSSAADASPADASPPPLARTADESTSSQDGPATNGSASPGSQEATSASSALLRGSIAVSFEPPAPTFVYAATTATSAAAPAATKTTGMAPAASAPATDARGASAPAASPSARAVAEPVVATSASTATAVPITASPAAAREVPPFVATPAQAPRLAPGEPMAATSASIDARPANPAPSAQAPRVTLGPSSTQTPRGPLGAPSTQTQGVTLPAPSAQASRAAAAEAPAGAHPSASDSVHPPSDGGPLKPHYVVRIAAFAAVLVLAWVGMKLLSNRWGDPASDSAANVAANIASSGASNATSSLEEDSAFGAADGETAYLGDEEAPNAPGDRLSPTTNAGSSATGRFVSTAAGRPANLSAAASFTRDPGASGTAELDTPPLEFSEVIPDVPASARRTIRGRVRVSVRVLVEKDGTVFAALADNSGPSRYFERLAIDAAKKWTFAPSETEDQRLMLVRFVFEREGTTASATALQ